MRTTLRKNPLTVLGAFAVAAIAGLWIAAGAVAWSGPADAEPGRGTVAEDSADENRAVEDGADPSTAEPERPADPRFEDCGDANDAGYGYYFMGEDPEYYWYDDADGNGVACEE